VPGHRRIASLRDLRRETKAWNRKMNRNRVSIDWQFTRRKARKKFGYKRNFFKLSETRRPVRESLIKSGDIALSL
jgi:hypothetical protein